jgi:hypothetical protein
MQSDMEIQDNILAVMFIYEGCFKSNRTAALLFTILNLGTQFYKRQISEHALYTQWKNQNNMFCVDYKWQKESDPARANYTIHDVEKKLHTIIVFILYASLSTKDLGLWIMQL